VIHAAYPLRVIHYENLGEAMGNYNYARHPYMRRPRAWKAGRWFPRTLLGMGAAGAFLGIWLTQALAQAASDSSAGYRVAPGDTLSGIASAVGTSVADLVALNHLADPDFIVAGQVLVLGDHGSSQPASYTVRAGDTLSAIATATGVRVERLAALNHLPDPDVIAAGTILQLPSSGASRGVASSSTTPTWWGSPNFWPGRPSGPPIALVLHTNGGTMVGTTGQFSDATSRVSAHFAIGLDGRVQQYVHLQDRAWANGILEPGNVWPGPPGVNPNEITVSIETEDLGSIYQPVTDAQYQATLAVGRLVLSTYPGIRYLVTHRAISPLSRPDDPTERWVQSGRFAALAQALGLKPIP